jgi:hypothetical protein
MAAKNETGSPELSGWMSTLGRVWVGGGTALQNTRAHARTHALTHTRNNSGGNNEAALSLQINTSIGRYAALTHTALDCSWFTAIYCIFTGLMLIAA